MLSKNVQEMIPKIQQYLASQPIEKAWLFGSCSRGEETPKSDIDLLVRYQDSDSISLFDISRIMVNLKKIIKRPVDLIEEDCLPLDRLAIGIEIHSGEGTPCSLRYAGRCC